MRNALSVMVALVLCAVVASCAKAPAIAWDKDSCQHCTQRISDKHYAAVMIGKDGKVYKFDAIECMADYIAKHKTPYKTLWVSNYEKPTKKMLKVEDATFIQSDRLHSPMGANVAAYRAAARAFLSAQYKGSKAMTWKETQVFLQDTAQSYRFHLLVQ